MRRKKRERLKVTQGDRNMRKWRRKKINKEKIYGAKEHGRVNEIKEKIKEKGTARKMGKRWRERNSRRSRN